VIEDKCRREDPLDGQVTDAILAAAATSRGLPAVTLNTGEYRNSGFETVDPWTASCDEILSRARIDSEIDVVGSGGFVPE